MQGALVVDFVVFLQVEMQVAIVKLKGGLNVFAVAKGTWSGRLHG